MPQGADYIVHFGPYLRDRARFVDFRDALACFREHYGELPERATLLGADHDYDSDGLSDDERNAVELAAEQAVTGGAL